MDILELAREEAMRTGCRSIEPDHIMLGILRDSGSEVCALLESLGVDLREMKEVLESSYFRAPAVPYFDMEYVRLSKAARGTMSLAVLEAARRGALGRNPSALQGLSGAFSQSPSAPQGLSGAFSQSPSAPQGPIGAFSQNPSAPQGPGGAPVQAPSAGHILLALLNTPGCSTKSFLGALGLDYALVVEEMERRGLFCAPKRTFTFSIQLNNKICS